MENLIGKKAPAFSANAVINGNDIVENFSLEQFIGKKHVVFFFYPLDFTFVCPTEIIAFQDKIAEFEKKIANWEAEKVKDDAVLETMKAEKEQAVKALEKFKNETPAASLSLSWLMFTLESFKFFLNCNWNFSTVSSE